MDYAGQCRFSANLGFLWKDRPFLERIGRAAATGFEAVEFHDDAQFYDLEALRDALAQAGLPVLGINVRMGQTAGCAAIPGMGNQARRDIDAAVEVAEAIGASAVHVLAGKVNGSGDYSQYLDVLRYALTTSDLTILIEPISGYAMPGYFLDSLDLAMEAIDEIGEERLKILFDCFHIESTHGDVVGRFRSVAPSVGHVQIASVPERSEPWPSRIDYAEVIPVFIDCGYDGAFGCEYTPASTVEAGLGWHEDLRKGLATAATNGGGGT
ncbi:TIM barrel protein [Chelativorans sp. Marseille-P2723]|uniref:hydroxypyruvate isomerase family protein n=1 Tax=Chelativorans sp. Marseille-P2723 TaxID=2709133 RepID=UPI00156E361C|nr:TIM barrel protein [Chelativorans sp. Marseille-P2723]